jgi:hypothetical protein
MYLCVLAMGLEMIDCSVQDALGTRDAHEIGVSLRNQGRSDDGFLILFGACETWRRHAQRGRWFNGGEWQVDIEGEESRMGEGVRGRSWRLI